MATIRFKDGTSKYADYYQAAQIYQVLIGSEEPKTAEQRLFVSRVASVEFPALPMPNQPVARKPHSAGTIKERRSRIRAIMEDPTLTGKQKYYHVREVLYGHPVPPEGQLQLV